MIHQYQNNGYNIVLDVNSGCVHVVDEPGYEVIACLNRMNENQTVHKSFKVFSASFLFVLSRKYADHNLT